MGDEAAGSKAKAAKPSAKRRRFTVGKARWIALVMLALFMVVRIIDPGPLETLRLKIFDFYQNIKPRPLMPNSPVTIVDLDEASLEEIGQWPWPRTTVARLVQNLVDMGSGPIGFDIFFVEEDRMSGANLADTLPNLDDAMRQKLKNLISNDQVFAQVIKKSRRVVLGQTVLNIEKVYEGRRALRSRVFVKGRKGMRDPREWIFSAPGILRNNAIIEPAGAGHGMVTILPEADGVVRRIPSLIKHKNRLYPTLAVEMLRLAFGRPGVVVEGDDAGITRILIAPRIKASLDEKGNFSVVRDKKSNLTVTTDNFGRLWPYFSRSDKKKYVSAADVLSGTVDPKKIKGRFVLIGTSAEGLKDIKTVPTERVIPGVEVHAQLIETILSGSYLSRPNFVNAAEMALALFGGLLIIVLVPWIGAKWTLLFFLVVATGAGGTSWYLFSEHRIIMDAAFAIITILLLYITLTYTAYAAEEIQRRQTRDAFSKYMSPAMVERVVADPSLLTLGGQKRDMTLLFCDVRGFTTISEQFDAEGLTVLINKLLTPLTNVILARKGTVDKYMGDCIMAFWNAPLDEPQHARQGCLAALEMIGEMAPLNERLEAEAKEEGRKHIPLKVGLGLNSGEAVVGNMGTEQRMDYSVLGDTVNTAARLEGQSKTYGVDIVIGPNTRQQIPDLATLELDFIQVKGKTVSLQIYALLGDETLAQDPAFEEFTALHEQMLIAYRGQKWATARDLIAQCRERSAPWNLEGLYDLYAGRIAAYEDEPPEADWDGVFIAKTK